jgi:hypothetical protein
MYCTPRPPKAKDVVPRTQKARGIINGLPALFNHNSFLCSSFQLPQHYLIQSEADLEPWKNKNFNFFARPCPEFPRHGFVESRPIGSFDKLASLFAEVVKEDPNGELLLGPSFSNVAFNAIYTDFGSLSIGPGNDGATGGKGSMQLTVAPTILSDAIKSAGGIKGEDAVYFEVIYAPSSWSKFNSPHLVQMRGGPAINAAERDFIPEKMTVTNVIIPNEDLLVWAKQVENLPAGTVVWGDGHTLASHAAVHCIVHNIPFITSRKPEVGETLAPSAKAKQKALSLEDFRRGVMVGMKSIKYTTSHMKDAFVFSLSVLHNWAYLRNTEHAAYLLGAAVATIEKICSSLVLGEYRHAKNSSYYGQSRNTVYEKAISTTGFTYVKRMKDAFESFCTTSWKSGFGGDAWAVCAYYSIRLWNALAAVYNKKADTLSDDDVASIMDTFNGMINLSHNTGWWFNKIASSDVLDMAAKLPGFAAASSAIFYLDVCEQVKSVQLAKKLDSITITDPFFVDKTKGVCYMYVTRDRLDWVVFKTQRGFKRATKYELTDKQRTALKEKISKLDNGKLYLKPQKNGSFKLGNRKFNPPCKLEASK